MREEKRRFTVITNNKQEQNIEREEREDRFKKAQYLSYQTNPLREQFMRFTNEEAGRRFSVEDLLKW